MARLEDDGSLVLSCPACRTFAQVRSGDRGTVCWQCGARLLVQVSGRQVKLVVAPPEAEPAPAPEATGDGPPPLPPEADQAPWPAGTVPHRRASRFPPVAWLIVAIMLLGGAAMLVQRLAGPGSPSVLRTPDGRIELELPAGWGRSLLQALPCQISATNPFQLETACVISQKKEGFAGLGTYGELVRKAMLGRLGHSEASEAERVQVNGYSALRFEITGTSRLGIDVGYVNTIVETETRFTQVMGVVLRPQFPDHKVRLGNLAGGLREVSAPAGR
jgi:hypothetical protein